MTATATAPIRTPFGEFSTAEEVADGIDLTGRRAVVTGASSGIGVEMARTLAARDAQVTLAVRNTNAGEQVAADIRTTAPEARLDDALDPDNAARLWTVSERLIGRS